jgi:hypothetical protein
MAVTVAIKTKLDGYRWLKIFLNLLAVKPKLHEKVVKFLA